MFLVLFGQHDVAAACSAMHPNAELNGQWRQFCNTATLLSAASSTAEMQADHCMDEDMVTTLDVHTTVQALTEHSAHSGVLRRTLNICYSSKHDLPRMCLA